MSRLLFLSAKAATVLCAIGIGFGIGSYLLYKLYCRLFPSDPKDREPVYTADKFCQRDQSNDVSTRIITVLLFFLNTGTWYGQCIKVKMLIFSYVGRHKV